jgi:large subunit ribosomal protein L23
MSIFDKLKKEPVKKTVASKKTSVKSSVAQDNAIDAQLAITTNNPVSKKVYGVLVKPLVTEKSTMIGALNQYVFEVATHVNKIQVAQAISQRYGIKPIKVNMVNVHGHTVQRGRYKGRTKDWKKAIVTLPAGKTITHEEGV